MVSFMIFQWRVYTLAKVKIIESSHKEIYSFKRLKYAKEPEFSVNLQWHV
jgi:hypothetical protein